MHAGLELGRLEEQHLTACYGLWGRSREEAAVTWGAVRGHLVRKWPRSQDGNGVGDPGRRGASTGAVSVASAVYTATEAVSSPANSAASFCSLNPGLHKLQSFTETPLMFPTSPYNLCPSLRHIFPKSTHRFLFYKIMFGAEVG